MKAERVLVVNADDFGFTRDVNEGIVAAHRDGILTATTLMANGSAFDHAVELARANPELDVGCHLVLVGGRSVSFPAVPLPATVTALLQAVALRRIVPYDELRAQVDRILAAGIRPYHLDTHKHTHLFPPVLDAVARLSEEYRIPWVRRPFDLPLTGDNVPWSKQAISHSLGFLRRRFHRVLTNRGCRVTDHFAGFQITGRFHAADVVRLIRALPPGITEFMCHPGYCTEELRAAQTRLKESREEELRALIALEAKAALTAGHVRLSRYRDL
ncbi:MAG: ChbG/HpnK family deacetylase [Bryobacteraceae bacterium]